MLASLPVRIDFSMPISFWVRRCHKWLGLIVGLQALLWMISGVYMTIVPLEVIHGDHLAHVSRETLENTAPTIDQKKLAELFPQISSLRMKKLLGREVFEIRQGAGVFLVDAQSGALLSPLPEHDVRRLANAAYQGEHEIASVRLLTEAPPEVATRPAPIWAVSYKGPAASTLYFSPQTGELLARRHNLWRGFDFLWMLHIMDYETRDDANNVLLRVASAAGLLFALAGIWLLLFSFRRRTP